MKEFNTEIEGQVQDLANEVMLIHFVTIDKILKSENPADAMALYCFYYRTSKYQGTITPWATDNFVKKGLKWGLDRLGIAKKTLTNLGLIATVRSRTKDGKLSKCFIKLLYTQGFHHNTQKPCVDEPTCGKQTTNTSNYNINTNNYNKKLTNVSTKKPPKEKGTVLQADWKPSVSTAKQLEDDESYPPGQIQSEYLSFVEYWTEGEGTGKTKINWNTAFKIWVRKRKPWINRNNTSGGIF